MGSVRVRAIQVAILFMLVGLTACVTNDTAPTVLPVARGQASVTINRPNGWYGAAVAVDIQANGAKFASIPAGGSFTGPVPPGPVTLTVPPGRVRDVTPSASMQWPEGNMLLKYLDATNKSLPEWPLAS
jgi:hypothetical protein